MQNVELSENIRTVPILFGSKSLVKKSPLGTIADYYTKLWRLNLLNVDRHKYLLLNEFKGRTVSYVPRFFHFSEGQKTRSVT